MIRPESLGLRPVDPSVPDPGIVGRISNIAFMGNHTRITVATADGDIVVLRPHGMSVRSVELKGELGQEACVWWSAQDAAFIGDGDLRGETRDGSTD